MNNQKLTPGSYWIGDPCYLFGDDWMEFLHKVYPNFDKGDCENMLNMPEQDFFVFNTRYGDGCYPVYNKGVKVGECGVDAGMLCVVRLDIAKKLSKWQSGEELGVIVRLDRATDISNNGGDVEFGDFSVITGEEDENEEENDY